jgi:aspartokinase
MELWSVKLPLTDLGDFAGLLASLDRQIRMPFLASVSPSSETDIHFSLLFELAHHDRIEQSLARNLPGFDTHCHGPSAIFFLHGPHFGDRYGIVNALVKALHKTGIDLLALSCAVSSISLVVPANESDRTIQALNSVFQTPTGQLKN